MLSEWIERGKSETMTTDRRRRKRRERIVEFTS